MTTHKQILEEIYAKAEQAVALGDMTHSLQEKTAEQIERVIKKGEENKGLLAVLITLVTHKIHSPQQDIRYHQAQLPGGFAGRGIDSACVTPFMKAKAFPSMAESGWLTRSLEQPHPYTLDYPGKITPKTTKAAFLGIIDVVESRREDANAVLLYAMKLLIWLRDMTIVDMAKPHKLPISSIISLLERHFTHKYASSGAARLPVLAMYAAYECIIGLDRYKGKILCPLESHTSADRRSGRIGDVDINNVDGTPFEGVEIKHEIKISKQLVTDAYEKFKQYKTDRYYLLTTANMDSADWDAINSEIQRILQIHGCQVIVNGVYSTLRYYLRLLPDAADFIDKYVELMKHDKAIKYQHKAAWNECVASI